MENQDFWIPIVIVSVSFSFTMENQMFEGFVLNDGKSWDNDQQNHWVYIGVHYFGYDMIMKIMEIYLGKL